MDFVGSGETNVYQVGCHVAGWPEGCGDGFGSSFNCGIANPSFEDFPIAGFPLGWGLVYGAVYNHRDARASMMLDTSYPQHGRHALRVVVPTDAPLVVPVSTPFAPKCGPGLQLAPHKVYNVSFFARSVPPGMALSGGTTGASELPVNATMAETLTGEWTEMRLVVATGAALNGGIAGSLALVATGAGHLFLDNFAIATSNVSTV